MCSSGAAKYVIFLPASLYGVIFAWLWFQRCFCPFRLRCPVISAALPFVRDAYSPGCMLTASCCCHECKCSSIAGGCALISMTQFFSGDFDFSLVVVPVCIPSRFRSGFSRTFLSEFLLPLYLECLLIKRK